MLYFSTALYGEAKPFLSLFKMKKSELITKFQFYQSDEACLIITNPGATQAAIAVTQMLTIIPPEADSLLINIGVCGTNVVDQIGTLFLCNKVTEASTNRTYYPDLLYKHPFLENQIITYPYVNRKIDELHGELADMEAAGIYQAASVFLGPHQIIIAKVPSDCMDDSKIDSRTVTKIIERQAPLLAAWILFLYRSTQKQSVAQASYQFSPNERKKIQKICQQYHFSKTMENQLKQYLIYYKVSTKCMENALSYLLDQIAKTMGKGQGTKEEGKKYLEKLKYAIL